MMRDTEQLLREMYVHAHKQVVLGKDDLEIATDWPDLRSRFEAALVREGIALPRRPELVKRE